MISTCIHVELEIRLQVGQQSQSGKTLALLRHCFSVTPGWTEPFREVETSKQVTQHVGNSMVFHGLPLRVPPKLQTPKFASR